MCYIHTFIFYNISEGYFLKQYADIQEQQPNFKLPLQVRLHYCRPNSGLCMRVCMYVCMCVCVGGA